MDYEIRMCHIRITFGTIKKNIAIPNGFENIALSKFPASSYK